MKSHAVSLHLAWVVSHPFASVSTPYIRPAHSYRKKESTHIYRVPTCPGFQAFIFRGS